MAIGGHIGDMELTCGGVLATEALKGSKIITVALTGGEKGNPPNMTVSDYRKQKEKEARDFAEALGGEAIIFPTADGLLIDNEETAMALCDIIREHKPDVLLTHWKNSIHKDHMATHHIVNNAQFFAGVPGFEREYPAHFASGPYYAENWEDAIDFIPKVYFEVSSEGFEKWKEIISLHWFTINSTSFRYKEYYTHLMSVRGIEARKDYAQTFCVSPLSERSTISEF